LGFTLKFVMKTSTGHMIFRRYLVTLFVPVFFSILAVLLYIAVSQIRSLLNNEYLLRENLLKRNRAIIQTDLDQVYRDINFLSELSEIKNYYRNVEQNTRSVNNIFKAFSKNRKNYHQVRLIDTVGWEKVRIDFRNEKIHVYSESELQNKSDRYYFQDMKKLGNDDFYISPFDLNIEHGEIEIPFVPVIRFGKAIENELTHERIFLIMNSLGKEMLSQMLKTSELDSAEFFLLNQGGYYMIGPNRQSEWRFHFADSLSGKFAFLFPEEWESIKSMDSGGNLKTKKGYFTFLKVNLSEYFVSRTPFEKSMLSRPRQEWILISYESKEKIFDRLITPILRKFILIALFAGIILLAFTWIFSKNRIQKTNEKEQRALHYQFLNTLVETFPHPIFYIDYVNREFGCNEAFESMTGRNREELRETGIEKLFDLHEPSGVLKEMGGSAVKVSEMSLKYPDDSVHKMLYYKANIMMNSSRIGLAGIFTDISHIHQVEMALRESEQKLIQANQTKDRFFSLIAHDLKNPFHAIIGLSHLLKTNYHQISNEDRESIINTIHQSSENMYQLLINLLDWARLQEGKIQINTERFEILSIVQECMTLFKPKIDEKKLNTRVDMEPDIRVAADKNMVRSIVRNLVGNAVKYTESGGSINISARPVGNKIEICISDSGIGINRNDLKNLLESKRSPW
jgi:nitrogen-specific signal transduction histidine kinase